MNGVKTEVDSTFDCKDHLNWIDSFHGNIKIDGDSTHKMIKVMMLGDDSNEVNMNFEILGNEEDGSFKMMINGEELNIPMDELHKAMKKMHGEMQFIKDDMEDIEIMIKDDENGELKTVKIIKKEDDNGNVTIKKIVNGKEVEMTEEDMVHIEKLESGAMGNKQINIDIDVDSKNGEKGKHIVIISKVIDVDLKDDMAKRVPKAKNNLNKNELEVEKLRFNPNPNNGRFDLRFNLSDNDPVQVKILDMNGKEVYDDAVNNFSGNYNENIDISEHGAGIYLLQIIQGNNASTHKIVIQ